MNSVVHPALAEAYSLALGLQQAHELPAAIEACHTILQMHPSQPETILLLGVCYLEAQSFQQALDTFDLALRIQPDWPDVHFNRGLVLRAMGRQQEAVTAYEAAIAANPGWAEAYNNLANALMDLGHGTAALDAFREAVRHNPQYVEAWFNLAHALQDNGQMDDALEAYERLVALGPHEGGMNNRGLVLMALGRPEQALTSFEEGIAAYPNNAILYNNRGVSLMALGRHADALDSFDRALAFDSDYAEAYYNRGNDLQELLRFEDAIASYRRATEINPEYADAHWNEALCRLVLGDLAVGWEKYEWRWLASFNKTAAALREEYPPAWDGTESVSGRRLLLYAEQGAGDTLQFCRYARHAISLGARVTLEVQPALAQLLSCGLSEDITVVAAGGERPPSDLSCALLSLPGVFRTDIQSIPADVPYLSADESKRAKWADRIGAGGMKRVGLVWSGSPTHKRDHHRSIPLAAFAPLFSVPGIEFVSLQPEVRESDQTTCQDLAIRQFGAELADYAETAALASLMDLVITVDTSVAHLAGAMGLPVWILLPRLPDWRWLLEREDSPWYPTARLFRQPPEGGWETVLARVTEALSAWRS